MGVLDILILAAILLLAALAVRFLRRHRGCAGCGGCCGGQHCSENREGGCQHAHAP